MINRFALFKKSICLFTVILVLLCFNSCVNRFNTKLDSYAHDYVEYSFLFENKINGVVYKNLDYDESDPESEEYIWSQDGPSDLIFIIENEERYKEIFTDEAPSVDFEKEMVILYIYYDVSPNLKHHIKSIKLKNGELYVTLRAEREIFGAGSTAPYPRCSVLTMKKTNLTSVHFEKP